MISFITVINININIVVVVYRYYSLIKKLSNKHLETKAKVVNVVEKEVNTISLILIIIKFIIN